MKGIVFDIRRGVTKDGPGLRTSVFLKGCPLRCVWCHNPESQSPEIERAATTDEVCGREMSVEEVMAEVCRDKVFYASSGGGVTITGGEPMMQADFAFALASAAHEDGIHVALDTCGFAPWGAFEKMIPVVDLFLYDLKCIDARRHRELTGVDNCVILENLLRLDEAGAKTMIRCPLVPGLNDSDEDIAAIRDFVVGSRVPRDHGRAGRASLPGSGLRNMEKFEICPYHPLGLEKYAKFGKKVLYDNPHPASKEDVARWERKFHFEA
ncbi:MAG: glycyl-radical enzyme activating protein [Kiritimatiellae bacterium]|nr:glycyl-radical enzyme activating protein [Kiritimatiellia bacterium]